MQALTMVRRQPCRGSPRRRLHGPDDLRHFLADAVAKWWVPDAIVFLESLPKTGTGNFLKTALREQFRNHYGAE